MVAGAAEASCLHVPERTKPGPAAGI
jgi:hypothetical protein